LKVVDLSHAIHPGMPVYPGTESPRFFDVCTIETDGFAEKRMTLFSHTGTHMDGPAHIISGGTTLDQLSPDRFYGKACVMDVRGAAGRTIDSAQIQPCEDLRGEVDFILLRSGWADLWNDAAYFHDYPVLTPHAANRLCALGLKGLGVDMISVDREGSLDFAIHHILLDSNILIIENLTNLNLLPPALFTFWCFPLKIENGEGSPVRAVAGFD